MARLSQLTCQALCTGIVRVARAFHYKARQTEAESSQGTPPALSQLLTRVQHSILQQLLGSRLYQQFQSIFISGQRYSIILPLLLALADLPCRLSFTHSFGSLISLLVVGRFVYHGPLPSLTWGTSTKTKPWVCKLTQSKTSRVLTSS